MPSLNQSRALGARPVVVSGGARGDVALAVCSWVEIFKWGTMVMARASFTVMLQIYFECWYCTTANMLRLQINLVCWYVQCRDWMNDGN